MRFITAINLIGCDKGSRGRAIRQFAGAVALLAIAACTSDPPEEQRGTIGFVQGFLGGVVADEPRAALIGRDVLSAGGSAADAAVAMYFALSVTRPSVAGLAGGGVCIVHEGQSGKRREDGKTEMIEFLARTPQTPTAGTTRPSAIPGNPRGFYALHSRYGQLPWSQLIVPAESLARFGTKVSRAFAVDLKRVGGALMADDEARKIFGGRDGAPLGEGDTIQQIDLAAVISRLRVQGPGELYAGPLANQFVDAVRRAGGTLAIEDLRENIPTWRETVAIPFGNNTVHFTAPQPAAGLVAAEMWSLLATRGRFQDADNLHRYHLIADAAMATYSDRARWMNSDGIVTKTPGEILSESRISALAERMRDERHTTADRLPTKAVDRPENPFATGFVALDRDGSAVACTVTMNNLFGTGRVAPGTGMILAALPGQGGRGADSLGPMMVINANVNEFFFAAAASGGIAAPTAMVQVAARTLMAEESLEKAIDAPRVHNSGEPDKTFHEKRLPASTARALAGMGHAMTPVDVIGSVNVIACVAGAPPHPESCSMLADPRSSGLALFAD